RTSSRSGGRSSGSPERRQEGRLRADRRAPRDLGHSASDGGGAAAPEVGASAAPRRVKRGPVPPYSFGFSLGFSRVITKTSTPSPLKSLGLSGPGRLARCNSPFSIL